MVTFRSKDFDIRKIAESGQCFRMHKRHGNTYAVVAYGMYVEVSQSSDMVTMSCSEEEFESVWKYYFDLDTDYSSIIEDSIRRYKNDDFLMSAISYGRGIRILRQEFFETLVSFIISQRKNIPSIKKCIENLSLLYGNPIPNSLYFSFPSPHRLSIIPEDNLKLCGVGYRAKYISSAAQWAIQAKSAEIGELSYPLSAGTLINDIHGVGVKVANCVCLFALHQLEACPIDVWMQRIIDEDYNGRTPEWMESEYAGLLQQFCFYYKRENV